MKMLLAKWKIGRLMLIEILIMMVLIVVANQAAAQGTRFFRISGPAATTSIAFRPDGTLVWSNAMAGTNYTVQIAAALPGGTNWVDYIQLFATAGVNTNLIFSFNPPTGMALIPAGVFTMGDTLDGNMEGDATPTYVTVSAFYMDVNLVNSNQWKSVYIWATNNGYGFVNDGLGKAANHPVQSVDWYDCVKWSNARSQLAGLTPAYYTDAGLTQIYTNGEVDPVYVNWTNSGYRLPTEAEWEKAARGGLSGQRFPWGNTISESQANYFGDTNDFSYDLGPNGYNPIGNYPTDSVGTSPVGSFAPNGYGLYDMCGNVFEWCWDWYGTPYPGGSDPRGPASGNYRILRGGRWDSPADYAACAFRFYYYPATYNPDWGFRCVRGL